MWVFPLAAALVAVLFAAALVRRYARSSRPYELIWALALLMYAGASLAVAFGVASAWTSGEFRVYWVLGAVLNVPFLAAGELELLFHGRGVRWTLYVLLAFITAYTVAVPRAAAKRSRNCIGRGHICAGLDYRCGYRASGLTRAPHARWCVSFQG